MRTEHNCLGSRAAFHNLPRSVHPIQPRHTEIQYGHFRIDLFCDLDGLSAVSRLCGYFPARLFSDKSANPFANDFIWICHHKLKRRHVRPPILEHHAGRGILRKDTNDACTVWTFSNIFLSPTPACNDVADYAMCPFRHRNDLLCGLISCVTPWMRWRESISQRA